MELAGRSRSVCKPNIQPTHTEGQSKLRNQIERLRKNEKGFTLIELLVVIVILGILAAVVVFAVSGLSDKGNTSACKIDTRTLRTAEEAYYANGQSPSSYGTMDQLIQGGFLSEASTLHDVTLTGHDLDGAGPGTAVSPYDITITSAGHDKGCGATDDYVGQATGDI
ncbi:MAG TPA: type II secretion system protein [Acidimicrobiales bacterium]|nr:type II secretion system protein [Acidimicrobiales bacterium]